jgi:hypothetical protein
MKGFLSQPKLEYVLFHLGCHIDLTPELSRLLFFVKNADDLQSYTNRIVFLQSAEDIRLEAVVTIGGLPILFPLSDKREIYSIDANNNLIFHHDILKSVFYLLSGYQEYQNKNSHDALNRFSFFDSIQCKLGITGKPIVNYYFEVIVQAIRLYGSGNNLRVSQRRVFNTFGFILSHDIDYVDLYTKNYFLYKAKEVIGIKQSKLSAWTNFRLGLTGFLKYTNLIKRDNPYWNFDFMRKAERDNNIRSVFYFLDKGILHSDAYYSFNEHRIVDLFEYLKEQDCEIGLHGTVESIVNRDKMQSSIEKLQKASNTAIAGVRQHRLLWHHPQTALIQESLGLKYDTTLGFAAHEGFRNSYCHPFRLYDFEKERMMELWEFPLNVMDVTLFAYQKYTIDEAFAKSLEVMGEVQKFGGVFSVLWHNSFFDEDLYPGITAFYVQLLKSISHAEPENILGVELVNHMDKFTDTYGKK